MASLDSLSIRVSADTADFMAGAEAVESQLGDLSTESLQTAAALEVLSNRANDAGDNISQAGNRANIASGQFAGLAGATSIANASFMGISATTWGSLIPAVVALGAALTPVLGALGGFVAVAGSIAGVGLLPVIGAIATDTEVLQERFNEIVQTIRSEFAPVFDMATGTLLALMSTFQDVIPELVPAESALSQIARAFERVGTTIINALPAFVELAVSLTQQFLPPFSRFLQDILSQLPGMIQGFVDVFSRMIPKFRQAGAVLVDFLPAFAEFGFTVLNVLGPAMTQALEIGTDFLTWLNQLDPAVQKSAAALSLLAPVIAVLGPLLSGPIVGALGTVAGLLLGPLASGAATVGNSLLLLGAAGAKLSIVLGSAIGTLTGLSSTLSIFGGIITSIGGSLASLLAPIVTVATALGPVGLLGLAIVGAIGLFVRFEDEIRRVVGQILPLMSDAVNSALDWVRTNGPPIARKAMKALGRVIRLGALEIAAIFLPGRESVILGAVRDMTSWLIANGPGLLEKAWGALVDVSLAAWRGFKQGLIGNSIIPETFSDIVDYLFNTAVPLLTTAFAAIGSVILAPIESALNRVFNLVGSGVNRLISIINNILSTLPPAVTSQLGFDQIEPIDFQRRETDVQDIAQRRQKEIRVVLDERTDIVEGRIENGAQNVVNQEQRRTRERQGRQANPR